MKNKIKKDNYNKMLKIMIKNIVIICIINLFISLPSLADINNDKKLRTSNIEFSRNKNFMVQVYPEYKLKIYDIKKKLEIKVNTNHSARISGISFSSDNNLFATSSEDKTVKLWKITGEEIKAIRVSNEGVYSLAFSNNGKYLATGSFKEIKLWDIETGEEVAKNFVNSYISSITFSKDDKYIVVGSNKKLIFFKSPELIKYDETEEAHDNFITDISINSSNILSTSSSDKTFKIWFWESTNKNKLVYISKKYYKPINKIEFSPNGKYIGIGTIDNNNVYIINSNTKKIKKVIYNTFNCNGFTFTENSKKLMLLNSSGKIDFFLLDI
ncbi:MAG: hypothetical protein U0354_07990 [Candidatus Sericytochromatia bacterium]